MTERPVVHSTLSLERDYPVPPPGCSRPGPIRPPRRAGSPARPVSTNSTSGSAAWRSPPAADDGQLLRFESRRADIVPDRRIVYTSTLHAGDPLMTVSLTTVELSAEGGGTRLLLAEQGAFLDGLEQPAWREQGTRDQLGALDAELRR